MRRLPLKGEVLVGVGTPVRADTVVARALLPGNIQAVRAGDTLGVGPAEVLRLLKKHEGDPVTTGELLAETKGLFGLFGAKLVAPVDGTIEYISQVTGTLGIRLPPAPLELSAYVAGTVTEVLPDEGVVVETTGAFIQGIFGVGGERRGRLKVVAEGPDALLDEGRLTSECAGCILVGGASANVAHLRKAAECGAVGLIVGAVSDAVLRAYLGFDIGVAITGQEPVPLTLILTEGFGQLAMADRTFALLSALEGREASINGATQIRAGVIRPEIVVPDPTRRTGATAAAAPMAELCLGSRVRIIREPYFGRFAIIQALPAELHPIDTEALVRVAEVCFDDQTRALIPRTNLEIIQG
jgi:hypothetical protein